MRNAATVMHPFSERARSRPSGLLPTALPSRLIVGSILGTYRLGSAQSARTAPETRSNSTKKGPFFEFICCLQEVDIGFRDTCLGRTRDVSGKPLPAAPFPLPLGGGGGCASCALQVASVIGVVEILSHLCWRGLNWLLACPSDNGKLGQEGRSHSLKSYIWMILLLLQRRQVRLSRLCVLHWRSSCTDLDK